MNRKYYEKCINPYCERKVIPAQKSIKGLCFRCSEQLAFLTWALDNVELKNTSTEALNSVKEGTNEHAV